MNPEDQLQPKKLDLPMIAEEDVNNNGANYKSPKVSSLYRDIEEQKLINLKLPKQVNRTQRLFDGTLEVLTDKHDLNAEFPL